MIIWLLALVLFGCLGYAGFAMGAIRAAASLLGLLVAALLAQPLGHFFNPVLSSVGLKNPVLVWLLGPLLAFLAVLTVFKIAGHAAHRKVDVYYKYKAGELRMGLFNRLNARVGICVGVANAAVYLILISWVVYVLSYTTTQIATGDTMPLPVKLLNTAGQNLQSSGMAKVAAAVDRMPETYYQTADILGLIYHNDLLEGRLSHYPGFLALGEKPEFQEIANDKEFMELRQKQPPIIEILSHPKAQTILNNPDLLKEIWATTTPHLKDLDAFLKTGTSAEYEGEKILGRWNFDFTGALNAVKRGKPNIGVLEMQRTKQALSMSFAKTTLMAAPGTEKLAVMKDYGKFHPATKPNTLPTVEFQSFKGTWSGEGDKYELSFPDKGRNLQAVVDGDRMIVTGDPLPMVFVRE